MKQEVATAISRFQEKSKTLPPREEGDKSGLAHISWAPGCTEDVLLMLARDGAVIVENAISPDTCDRIKTKCSLTTPHPSIARIGFLEKIQNGLGRSSPDPSRHGMHVHTLSSCKSATQYSENSACTALSCAPTKG